jgi:hypothetical protein
MCIRGSFKQLGKRPRDGFKNPKKKKRMSL